MGQRLEAYSNVKGDGVVQVHAYGCRDTRKFEYQTAIQIDYGQTEWTSQEAFGRDHWSDINAERGDGEPEYVFEDIKFHGCVILPRDEPVISESFADFVLAGGNPADYHSQEGNMAEKTKTEAKADKPAKDLPGKAPGEVKAPRAASSKALPGGKCRCGCGKEVGRTSTFAQGHDARWVSKLVQQVEKGDLAADAAIKLAGEVSEKLAGKVESAIKNANEAAIKKAEAERAKAEKAAAAKAAKAKAEQDKADKSAASDDDLDADDAEDESDGDLDLESEDDEDDDEF